MDVRQVVQKSLSQIGQKAQQLFHPQPVMSPLPQAPQQSLGQRFNLPNQFKAATQYFTNPTSYGGNNFSSSPVMRTAANLQHIIESPKSFSDYNQFKFDNSKPAPLRTKIAKGAANMAMDIGTNIAAKGILDPLSDIGRLGGYAITGQAPQYDQFKSGATRLAFNALGTKRTPQQVLGNAGSTLEPIVNAYGGEGLFGIGKEALEYTGKQTAIQLAKQAAKQGAKYGAASGLVTGLSNNRQAKSLATQLVNTALSTAEGGAMGAAMGGLTSLGITGSKYLYKTKPSQVIDSVAKYLWKNKPDITVEAPIVKAYVQYRNTLGQFSKKAEKVLTYDEFRTSIGAPNPTKPNYGLAESSIKVPEDVPGTGMSADDLAKKMDLPTGDFKEPKLKVVNGKVKVSMKKVDVPEGMTTFQGLQKDVAQNHSLAHQEAPKQQSPEQLQSNILSGSPSDIVTQSPEGKTILTQAGKEKMGNIMYGKDVQLTPKTDLLSKIAQTKDKVNQDLFQQREAKQALLSQLEALSSKDLQDIQSVRQMANSKVGQSGDIETLYRKNPELMNRVLDRMREITGDYQNGTNRSDEELLKMALNLPTKSSIKVTRPTEYKDLQGMKEEVKTAKDLVYHAEPSKPGTKAHDDFKEWSNMVFKDASKAEQASKTDAVSKLTGAVKESTTKGLQAKYVHDPKGKIPTNKVGQGVSADEFKSSELWKDKSKLSLVRETMDRNFEDIMGKDAPVFKKKYLEPITKAEANRQRWLNNERSQIKSLGIKARSKESALVQQFGEGNISWNGLLQETGGDVQKAGKIKTASLELRRKYDSYLDDINVALKRNGYDPIPKRKDYFTHFQEVSNVLEQIGIPVRDTALPTDVNGMTADFKPGKNFFSNALPRLTEKTNIDAITGIDRYIEGASKQIFHTDNIQNLRLFEKALRAKYAGTTHLTNFASEIGEYTNTLAGKKPMVDRAAEALVGRGIYAGANRLKKQVGANMVGANMSSALTNFIPLTQSIATTSKQSAVKGMAQTITNVFKNDGFIDRSDFLTRRMGSDPLSMRLWDKAGQKAGWLFKTIDNFTSQVIVRSKYDEAISKGLSPQAAMQKADEWAAKVMADRSLGQVPSLFNSKTLGFLTQFQLEVNNQVSFMAKDIPRNFSKVGAASALAQVFLYSYLYNNLTQKLTGQRPAFDPIGVGVQTYQDYNNPDMKKGQATKNLIGNVSNQLPFASTLTGGRLPLGSAIPNPMAVTNGTSTLGKELKKPLYYLLLPFGGGQIKKTIEGLGAYNQGVSQTDSGRVRYAIPNTPTNAIRTGLFGQYSTPEATKYFRNGDTPLGDKQSQYLLNQSDKPTEYQNIMQKRKADSIVQKQKDEFKKSSAPSLQVENNVFIKDAKGEIRTIDLNKKVTKPNLTNNAELDKTLMSKYNSEITAKENDIRDLYSAGKLSPNEANEQIKQLELQQLKDKVRDIQQPNLTGNVELDKSLMASYNSKLTSQANTIRDLYAAGTISAQQAELQLEKIKGMRPVKAKKAKRIKIKMPKLAKIKAPKSKKLKMVKFKKIKPLSISKDRLALKKAA